MSSRSPIKRSLGERQETPLSTFERLKTPLTWLSAGALALAVELWVSPFAPHRAMGERLALAFSVALLVWGLRGARLSPPSDPLSRLRAKLSVEARLLGVLASVVFCVASVWHLHRLATRPAPVLSSERVLSYAPLPEGSCVVSGTPKIEDPPYRWALEGLERDEPGWVSEGAPYLTPLLEFKGQLLVLSREPITKPLQEAQGRLLSAREVAQGSFMSYRSYMSVPREAPIYLVDLRARPWFDTRALVFLLWSLTLLIGFWSAPTRDPLNSSTLTYIPPELLAGLGEAGDEAGDDEVDEGEP